MSDMFSDLNWFAVVTHLGKWSEAKEHLDRQRYRTFLPMCQRVRSHAGKKEIVERPLFNRYLFVGVGFDQAFSPICNSRGVAFVVRGMGGIPCAVPPQALRAIKARCDADGGMVDLVPQGMFGPEKTQPHPGWQPGARLRISEGVWADFLAVFEGYHGGVARVALELFGREVSAEIDVRHLEPAA